MKRLLYAIMFLGVTLMLITSCGSDDKNAKLQVWLTDSPGDYQEVNIDIIGVEVNSKEGESGWKSLNIKAGVYNLLTLTNGLDTLLGDIEIPAGKISQIRLILGSENTIKVGDQLLPLSTPSATQSGLKLQVHETLAEGITYKILLDFDVARSIVVTGNDQYKLKPVIRTVPTAVDGAIKGSVDPIEATPAVYVIDGLDTLATSYADNNGQFLLRGLAAGTYKVVIIPRNEFVTVTKEDVSVTLGEVTDIGTIQVSSASAK
jgi:hypothetical protein